MSPHAFGAGQGLCRFSRITPGRGCYKVSHQSSAALGWMTFDMTIFAKKTMSVTEWAKVQDLIGALQISMGAPHDLMMFSAKGSVLGEDDIYIGLPDASLLSAFPASKKSSGRACPTFS